MPGTTHIFDGNITENSRTIASGQISVFLSSNGIWIRPHMDGMFRGKELLLSSFISSTVLNPTAGDSIAIHNDGINLGLYSHGPLGHPGDGEFEIYKVIKTSIFEQHEKDGLNIQIEAETGRGKDVCHFANEESEDIHPPLTVRARFLVPNADLEKFFEPKHK